MSLPRTALTELLGLAHPIVQAPMAGGPTTPELVAAVSNAGGLGSLGAAAMTPEQIRAAVRRVRQLTDRPFQVNVFAPHERPEPDPHTVKRVDTLLAPYRAELGLEQPDRTGTLVPPDPYEEQLAVVLEERVPVFGFVFGLPPLEPLREAGITVLGTATSVAEAAALERAGVDAVVAQGAEAGGHRGTFSGDFERGLVGTLALVPQVVDAVGVPVVAAGGIADGRGVAAALALGAAAAQVGTAFLPCPEAGIPAGYKRAVLEAADDSTAVTRFYTGRPARSIRTPLIAELEAGGVTAGFPAQAYLLGDLRAAASERDAPELLFLLAGQAAALSRELPAGEVVDILVREAETTLRGLGSR